MAFRRLYHRPMTKAEFDFLRGRVAFLEDALFTIVIAAGPPLIEMMRNRLASHENSPSVRSIMSNESEEYARGFYTALAGLDEALTLGDGDKER